MHGTLTYSASQGSKEGYELRWGGGAQQRRCPGASGLRGPPRLTRQPQLQLGLWPLPTARQSHTCVFLFSISVPGTLCLFCSSVSTAPEVTPAPFSYTTSPHPRGLLAPSSPHLPRDLRTGKSLGKQGKGVCRETQEEDGVPET